MVSVMFGMEVIKAGAHANPKTESSLVVHSCWERGKGEKLMNGVGFRFGVRKCSGIKSLRWMYNLVNILLNCIV